MATPAHFADGISNTKVGNPLYGMGQLDPTTYKTWFNDFFGWTAGDWTVTETQVGATQAAITGDGGLFQMVNSAANNDYTSVQWAGGSGATIEPFLLDSAKDFFMKARFKVSNATNAYLMVGLAITDTTPADVTNGVYFQKAAASTSLLFGTEKANTASTATITTMADDTFIEVGMNYIAQGSGNAVFRGYYKNSSGVWVNSGSTLANTNLPIVTLTPTIATQNGTAAAITTTIDYLFIAQQR